MICCIFFSNFSSMGCAGVRTKRLLLQATNGLAAHFGRCRNKFSWTPLKVARIYSMILNRKTGYLDPRTIETGTIYLTPLVVLEDGFADVVVLTWRG